MTACGVQRSFDAIMGRPLCKPWGDAMQTSHFVSALVLTATLACPHAARAQLSRVYPGGIHQYVMNSEMQLPSVTHYSLKIRLFPEEGQLEVVATMTVTNKTGQPMSDLPFLPVSYTHLTLPTNREV